MNREMDKLFFKYQKLRPFYLKCVNDNVTYDRKFVVKLVEKPSFSYIKYVGYLFSPKKLNKDEFDENDKEINKKLFDDIIKESNTGKYVILKFTGLHTSGGYNGFFRPDLQEVCNIIPDYVFEKSRKIYVTTDFLKNVPLFDEDIGITTAICVL